MFSSTLLTLATLALTVFAAPTPELEERQACADVIVVFARGTTEASPIGSVVGPPFRSALDSALGSRSLSFRGVSYPADVAGFLAGGSPAGSRQMAADLTSAANSCPNAAIVASGYSQGGQLVHNALEQVSAAVSARVTAAVIFGDPKNGESIRGFSSSKLRVFCNLTDNICAHGFLILPAHLTYGSDTPAAAAFVVGRL